MSSAPALSTRLPARRARRGRAARGPVLLGVVAAAAGCLRSTASAPPSPAPGRTRGDTGTYGRQDLALAGVGSPVYRIPALATTARGTAIAAYDARPVGPGLDENKSVELSDGTLMLNSRARPFRKVAYSGDGGVTWTGLHADTQLVDPNDNGAVVRYDVNAGPGTLQARWLLFSNNESTTDRKNLVVRMSCDDGRTWPVRKVVEPGFAAYSTLARLPDGAFGLLGESDEYRKITFSKFDRRWLGGRCE